jgi:hypothetical protein
MDTFFYYLLLYFSGIQEITYSARAKDCGKTFSEKHDETESKFTIFQLRDTTII